MVSQPGKHRCLPGGTYPEDHGKVCARKSAHHCAPHLPSGLAGPKCILRNSQLLAATQDNWTYSTRRRPSCREANIIELIKLSAGPPAIRVGTSSVVWLFGSRRPRDLRKSEEVMLVDNTVRSPPESLRVSPSRARREPASK